MQRFINRAVLITGAAGSLGRAAAERFGAEGARLALLDRDEARVAALAHELAARGYPALALAADVADEPALAGAFAHAEAHFGRLDVVFNNAGVGGMDLRVAEIPTARWDEMLAINLRGVFLGCKHAIPALARAGGGAIVNMGSSTGRHDTLPGSAAYMASKAGVEALTKSVALQVARQGIRVNAICPGIIETGLSFSQGRNAHISSPSADNKTETPSSLNEETNAEAKQFFARFAARIPLGRVGQPADVAAAVAFLASDQARAITGAALLIDGGQTLRRWVSAPE
ncbi:MAG: SDR family oxidoreductase [Kouleothrix sp.]|jgi:NAD(P)-dependent dehydrogenase (short-subunit alcohol dehydrogenase family)|nr:SDR family oxidoreductase [Kouleothrix sp.]